MSGPSLAPGNSRKGKRKAAEELSTNPHTVKARKRRHALAADPVHGKIEKAKEADRHAAFYQKQKLHRTAKFKKASAREQRQMIKKVIQASRESRYVRTVNSYHLWY
jgi:hypothetical protein